MACGWSAQLDHDDEMGPMRGMYGTPDAELEVQRTFQRAELTAVLFFLRWLLTGPERSAHYQGQRFYCGSC